MEGGEREREREMVMFSIHNQSYLELDLTRGDMQLFAWGDLTIDSKF